MKFRLIENLYEFKVIYRRTDSCQIDTVEASSYKEAEEKARTKYPKKSFDIRDMYEINREDKSKSDFKRNNIKQKVYINDGMYKVYIDNKLVAEFPDYQSFKDAGYDYLLY